MRTEQTRAADSGDPINPQLVFTELSARLPELAVVTADAGTTSNWSARNLQLRSGMKYSLSGGLASMGSAVPYAIAAKFAFPDRPVSALAGDGAMQMNGSAELLTIAKYWRGSSDPRLVVLVPNNRDFNQVTWEQRVESGDPKFAASQDCRNSRTPLTPNRSACAGSAATIRPRPAALGIARSARTGRLCSKRSPTPLTAARFR